MKLSDIDEILSVFRGMSNVEYDQAMEQGYLESDNRYSPYEHQTGGVTCFVCLVRWFCLVACLPACLPAWLYRWYGVSWSQECCWQTRQRTPEKGLKTNNKLIK
jgi:hypothetical protein